MKNLLVLGLLAGVAYLVKRGADLNNLVDNITTRVSNARVHQLSFSGITVAANVQVNNPTNSTCQISKPVVYLTSNGAPLGESNATGGTIKINPQAVTDIGSFYITIPLLTALQYFTKVNWGDLVNGFSQNPEAAGTSLLKQLSIPLEISVALYADSLFIKTSPLKIA